MYIISSVDTAYLPCYYRPPTQHHSFIRKFSPFLHLPLTRHTNKFKFPNTYTESLSNLRYNRKNGHWGHRTSALLIIVGFPIVHGRVKLLRVPDWSDSSCQTVVFPPYRFYPNKEVQVQITLNHMNLNDSVTVHHAITFWTERINTQNFTVCAMQSGRNGDNFNPFAIVDWMAYQGAPPEGTTGTIKMTKWWSGTNCANVTFPKVGLH